MGAKAAGSKHPGRPSSTFLCVHRRRRLIPLTAELIRRGLVRPASGCQPDLVTTKARMSDPSMTALPFKRLITVLASCSFATTS